MKTFSKFLSLSAPIRALTLALTLALTVTLLPSCRRDEPPAPPKPTAAEIVQITDGRITAPQWLVDELERIADLFNTTPAGAKIYPQVYSFEYKGEECIHLFVFLSSSSYQGELFFTLDGRRLPSGFNPVTERTPSDDDMWNELAGAFLETHRELRIENYSYRATTSATRQLIVNGPDANIKTPNGKTVPFATINTEQILNGNAILNQMAAQYPQAHVLDGPTTTYNCHGYAWYMTEPRRIEEQHIGNVWINFSPLHRQSGRLLHRG